LWIDLTKLAGNEVAIPFKTILVRQPTGTVNDVARLAACRTFIFKVFRSNLIK
jgi:hypothetical protein